MDSDLLGLRGSVENCAVLCQIISGSVSRSCDPGTHKT